MELQQDMTFFCFVWKTGSTSKRRSKWHLHNCYVSMQGNWSSWRRSNVSIPLILWPLLWDIVYSFVSFMCSNFSKFKQK